MEQNKITKENLAKYSTSFTIEDPSPRLLAYIRLIEMKLTKQRKEMTDNYLKSKE